MNSQQKQRLKAAYKFAPTYYGVIQIENTRNRKIFIDTVANLHNRWGYYQLNLNQNFYHGTPLQADWLKDGAAAFTYTVLWKADAADVVNMRQTLKTLQDKWLRRLTPFGDRGYNHRPRRWDYNQPDSEVAHD